VLKIRYFTGKIIPGKRPWVTVHKKTGQLKVHSHNIFIIFLLMATLLAVAALSIRGCDYYSTPIHDRPFHPEYQTMKPSGPYSHGVGIVGALLIVVGVAMYSSRKRLRALHNSGKISRWLEIHIILCLVGPILVVYHTTFKAGGIAAISLWTMLSVAASGIIGRFLYVQIPHNKNGTQLTAEEITAEIAAAGASLGSHPVGRQLLAMADRAYASIPSPDSLIATLRAFVHIERSKRQLRTSLKAFIARSGIVPAEAHGLIGAASHRSSLMQRIVVLHQVERIFFYWHAVHLPFTIIMFLTLAAHVTVAIVLGYTWIF
jgi:hypothetical protein